MKYPTPGRFKEAAELHAALQAVDPEVHVDLQLEGQAGPLGRPFERAGLRLANRFAIHPMEGWDGTADGSPSELTLRRWKRFGRSGAGLLWGGEAFAVDANARANPRQLALVDAARCARDLDQLRAVLQAGRQEVGLDPTSMILGLQLTDSGRYSRPQGRPTPRIAQHHPILDERLGVDPNGPVLSDAELEGLIPKYVHLARLAQQAGFHFVDIKACHGYLLHELLAARTRSGIYGGDLLGRTRLLTEIVDAIHRDCPGLVTAVRLSAHDAGVYGPDPATNEGVRLHGPEPFGHDLAETGQVLQLLQQHGVDWINATLGSPYSCPHLQRPASYPPTDGYAPPIDPLASVATHIRVVREIRRIAPQVALVGSGYSYLMEYLPHLAQAELRAGHVDVIGIGRMVLSYPEFPSDVLAGRELDRRRICRTFSDCTNGPRQGLVSGCYPLDAHYRSQPQAQDLLRSRPRWK